MHSSQTLNLGQTPGKFGQESMRVEGDSSLNRELIEQTRSDLQRMQVDVEQQQDAYETYERRTKILGVVVVFLLICMAAGFWLVYPTLKDQKNAAAGMPVLQTLANKLGERLESVESNLGKMTAGLPPLVDRMDQLQGDLKTNLQAARDQAQAVATKVGERVREDVSRSMQAIQSRLTGVESNQKEAAERVTQLQDQVAGLQRELTAVREEASTASERVKAINDAQQSSKRDVSGLNERVVTNQAAISSLANRIDRKRVDFEVEKRQTKQIAPNIQFTLNRIDTGKKEVDGTLQVGAEAMSLPVQRLGIQKPMMFYAPDEDRPMELVFTQVSKNAVSGYLVVPVGDATTAPK